MTDVHTTTEVYWDAAGEIVPVDDPTAVAGEATDYDADGNVILRTHLVKDTEPPPPTVDIVDALIESEPTEWDLTLAGEPVTTLTQLQAFLLSSTGTLAGPEQVAEIVLYPGWSNAPDGLKGEVYAYLSNAV